MNTSSVFLIAGILIVAVGVAWIVSGGPVLPSSPVAAHAPVPVTTPAAPAATSAVAETTVPVPAASPPPAATATAVPSAPATATPAPTPTVVSGDDVRNHFLDIAYTATNRIEMIDTNATKSRLIIAATSATDDDLAAIEKAAKIFNDASTTVKLSENVKETDNGDILFRFLPEDGVNSIDINTVPLSSGAISSDVLTSKELYQGNVIGAKIVRGTIYLNANLKGDAKRHVIVRSLMYQMGLTGETTKYPDSIFYAQENTNVNFAPIDTKAIAMLYNSGFTNRMGGEDLRRIIYTPG